MAEVAIGIDLGGTNIKAGAVSPQGDVVVRRRLPTRADGGPDMVADRIAEAARACMEALEGTAAAVLGVGVGSPGTIRFQQGVVTFAPNLPGFHDVPLRDMVAERMGLPCVLENDANAAAVAEQWVGAGQGADSLVMLTLGTGIGGGIVLEGRVWHGTSGAAGEIGHMSINPDGPACGCGNRGCIEAYASATAIVRRMDEAIEAGAATSLAGRTGNFTSRDVYEAAVAGDAAARENVETTGRYLGVAVSNLIHILNPMVVVLSGGVSAARDMLVAPLRDEVDRRTMAGSREGVQIRIAELGEEAGFIGAARCFMNGPGGFIQAR